MKLISNEPLYLTFGRLSKIYIEVLSKKLNNLVIEKNFFVMLLIHEYNQKLSQKDIAGMLNIDKSSMVRITDYLCEKGFIERSINKSDRRAHVLKLTESGLNAIPQIQKSVSETNLSALTGVNPADLDNFYTIMETIFTNLGKMPRDQYFMSFQKIKQS